MDVEFEVAGKLIVWDENKAASNKKKHKVSFETAAEVFLDENRYEEFDEFHSDDEYRYKTVGMVDNILTVIYTERKEKTRLISARRAVKSEVQRYYGQYSNL